MGLPPLYRPIQVGLEFLYKRLIFFTPVKCVCISINACCKKKVFLRKECTLIKINFKIRWINNVFSCTKAGEVTTPWPPPPGSATALDTQSSLCLTCNFSYIMSGILLRASPFISTIYSSLSISNSAHIHVRDAYYIGYSYQEVLARTMLARHAIGETDHGTCTKFCGYVILYFSCWKLAEFSQENTEWNWET